MKNPWNSLPSNSRTSQTLFDFTRTDQLGNWTECSDTVKITGMSKAVFVIQKTQLIQRAILFTLFNPRPNRTGYAAVRCDTNFDLSGSKYIAIKCRGQGINYKYKMLLRHKGFDTNNVVYGQVFTVIFLSIFVRPISEVVLTLVTFNSSISVSEADINYRNCSKRFITETMRDTS